jgi:hypothetical protein
MATLEQIFNEIRYGKEVVEATNSENEIKELIEEDYNIFLRSKRLNNILKEEVESTKENIFKSLNSISKNFEEYETKITEGKKISPIYARMKTDTIFDRLEGIYEEVSTNIKTAKSLNKKNFIKAFATIEEGYESLSKVAKVKPKAFTKIQNYLENGIKQEKKYIKEATE